MFDGLISYMCDGIFRCFVDGCVVIVEGLFLIFEIVVLLNTVVGGLKIGIDGIVIV